MLTARDPHVFCIIRHNNNYLKLITLITKKNGLGTSSTHKFTKLKTPNKFYT